MGDEDGTIQCEWFIPLKSVGEQDVTMHCECYIPAKCQHSASKH